MANVLFLAHRMPYPPNKGDKVRSYHLLRHLQRQHRVFLGTFIDTHEDDEHLPALRALCPDLHVERIQPRWDKLCSLTGLLRREPLTMAFYRHAGMRRWVQGVTQEHALDSSVVFTSAMVQYAELLPAQTPMLVDFVDVDSEKWRGYAPRHAWPMSWVYRREAHRLLSAERRIAARARRAFFVTPAETRLFSGLAPECADRVQTLCNGVDSTYFQPDPALPNPFSPDEDAVVFVGAMDYWPNADGAQWFAREVMPLLSQLRPRARFHIVGRHPTRAVQRLAGDRVVVSGGVPDVRPYLQHAGAVVVPLRLARGIQNKLLEAMAMGKAVVTSPASAEALDTDAAAAGLAVATDAQAFADAVCALLAAPAAAAARGKAARAHVATHFQWSRHLDGIDPHLPPAGATGESAQWETP